MPPFIPPQLCKRGGRPPSGGDWVHEIKLDGYRMQLRVVDGETLMRTRKGLDWTEKFASVAKAAKGLPDCIIDGEVCALDHNGAPDFAAPWLIGAAGPPPLSDSLCDCKPTTLKPYVPGVALRRIALGSCKCLAFKTLQSKLLRKKHVAHGEIATRTKTPPFFAFAVRVQLLDIDHSNVPDDIPSSSIAACHHKPPARTKLCTLDGTEMRFQQF